MGDTDVYASRSHDPEPVMFLYFFTVTRTAAAAQGDERFSAKSIAHDLLLDSLKAERKQFLSHDHVDDTVVVHQIGY